MENKLTKEDQHSSIPKIIHQIWIGDRKNPVFWSNIWKELYIENNRDWEYKLWDNENCWDELKKYPILEKIYTILPHNCHKADILRYIILYEYGGVYIDIDSIWLNNKSLNNILDELGKNNFFIGRTPNENEKSVYYLTNGVIGCSKNNDIMMEIIDEIIKIDNFCANFLTPQYINYISSSKKIGPGLVTKILKNKSANDITILPSYYFYPIIWHNIRVNTLCFKDYKNSFMFQYGLTTNNLIPKNDLIIYWKDTFILPEKKKELYEFFALYMIYNKKINTDDEIHIKNNEYIIHNIENWETEIKKILEIN